MSEGIEQPLFSVPEEPSFLVKEGKVYKITELSCDVEKAFSSINKWYAHKVKEAIEPFVQQRGREDQESLKAQLAHIAKHNQIGHVVVPANLVSGYKPLVVIAGKVYVGRLVQYSPQKASFNWSTLGEWISYLSRSKMGDLDQYKDLCAMWDACEKVLDYHKYFDVELNQNLINFPCMVAYDKVSRRLIVNPRTFHTYSDNKLCTGIVSAEMFFNQKEFEDNFNSINFSSLAHELVGWTYLLQDKYITNWEIRKDSAWTT